MTSSPIVGLLRLASAIARRRGASRRTGTSESRTRSTYSALAISNEMTAMGMRRSAMGHNKLVQIVQGNAIALGRPILVEMPRIWRYGPVLETLYHIQNHLGHAIIDSPLRTGPFDDAPRVDPEDAWTIALIRRVIDAHERFSNEQLSSMLHAEGTPWKDEAAHHGFVVSAGARVPEWRIARHYRTHLTA